jgi:protein-arginine kinase activator protein McsA
MSADFQLQALASNTKPCPNCRASLRALTLAGHYGRWVEVEVCEPCHLLWFDGFESVNIAALGVLTLVREVVRSHERTHTQTSATLACPSCTGGLRLVRDKTRFGETLQHRCTLGHGSAQTFAQYLAEKGVLRTLSRAEVVSLMSSAKASEGALPSKALFCVNCGAMHRPTRSVQSSCHYCGSAFLALDMAGLLAVVDPYDATQDNAAGKALKMLLASQRQLNCPHCGFTLDATRHAHCPSCKETIVVTDLRFALQLLEALAPLIEKHHAHMVPKEAEARLNVILGGSHFDKGSAADRFSVQLPESAKQSLHWTDQPLSFVAHVGVLIAAVATLIIIYLVKFGI